jgi:SAM-dependent methyltransferase
MKLSSLLLQYMEYSFRKTINQVYSSPERLMLSHPQAVLLDCGCGDGSYSQHLGQVLGTTSVYGVELNRGKAYEASLNGVHVLRSDVNMALPLGDNSVHVVTAFNVLEHLVETRQFLAEIYRVLRPGGYAIINTPNLASWHNIAALLLGIQPFSGPNISSMTESDVPIVQRMHRRSHNLPEDVAHYDTPEPERHRHIVVVAFRSLIKALQHTGFDIEHALGYGYYPLPPFLAWVMSRFDPAHAHHMVLLVRKPVRQVGAG